MMYIKKILYIFLCCSLPYCNGQIQSFTQVIPSVDCDSSSFFNSANLQCETCSDYISNSQPINGTISQECICQSNYEVEFQSSTTDYFSCTLCGVNTCSNAPAITCSANEVLVETYSNLAYLEARTCVRCDSLSSASFQFQSCEYNPLSTLATNVTLLPQDTASPYILNQLSNAVYGCEFSTAPNITACQALANLCVLQFYLSTATSCASYTTIFGSRASTPFNSIAAWRENLPMIYYTNFEGSQISASQILTATDITFSFPFGTQGDPFQIWVSKYDFNGTYLGSELATTGILQLCPDRPTVESSAFVFGTSYMQSCQLTAVDLADLSKYPAMTFDLNLRVGDLLYPLPILIDSEEYLNNAGSDTSTWEFFRRFFLVDSLSTANTPTPTIRYASSMVLSVILQPGTSGTIYPPYLRVTYSSISTTSTDSVGVSFGVFYTMALNVTAFQIALPILGSLGLIYALAETSSWRRRRGLQIIDGWSLLMFIYFSLGMLANAFFVVMFGYSLVTLLFFKGQQVTTTFPPNQDQRNFFVVFTSLAFAFKAIDVLGMIIMQSLTDIFLIDWERPKSETEKDKVSIWRTYFIANEWNEIQTFRKTRFTFQLLTVLFFLEIVGFKSLAIENPNSALSQTTNPSPDDPEPVYNPVLRFGIGGFIYTIVAFVQVLYQVVIHERLIADKIREFADLCSVSNISILILSNRQFGYYIHGRSVHGRADTDMLDMHAMLKKEENNLTAGRGLETGSEIQTFLISVSNSFRLQYDKIYQPLELVRNQPSARGGGGPGSDIIIQESLRVHSTMRKFLTSFIDHSLREFDYTIRDKLFLENILNMEFQEAYSETAFFYNDPQHSFTNNLFYGRESTLFIFDFLLFTMIDYHTFNYLLAAILTYIVGKILAFLRQSIGRSNLARKTLVDKRFLI